MNIGVAKERAAGEQRVALGPESIAKLVKGGASVLMERGAGAAAGFPDAVFEKAGASLVDDAASLYARSAIVLRVQPPTVEEVALLPEGSVLISSMPAATNGDLVKALAARKITAFALEKVPRITRAQSMDMLSSQSTVSGYKAVLIGAAALPKFLPSLTTAAGSIPPARVFVLGAGVAGLQAIATARRLGAIVSAFDVRAAARGAGDEPRRDVRGVRPRGGGCGDQGRLRARAGRGGARAHARRDRAPHCRPGSRRSPRR